MDSFRHAYYTASSTPPTPVAPGGGSSPKRASLHLLFLGEKILVSTDFKRTSRKWELPTLSTLGAEPHIVFVAAPCCVLAYSVTYPVMPLDSTFKMAIPAHPPRLLHPSSSQPVLHSPSPTPHPSRCPGGGGGEETFQPYYPSPSLLLNGMLLLIFAEFH